MLGLNGKHHLSFGRIVNFCDGVGRYSSARRERTAALQSAPHELLEGAANLAKSWANLGDNVERPEGSNTQNVYTLWKSFLGRFPLVHSLEVCWLDFGREEVTPSPRNVTFAFSCGLSCKIRQFTLQPG